MSSSKEKQKVTVVRAPDGVYVRSTRRKGVDKASEYLHLDAPTKKHLGKFLEGQGTGIGTPADPAKGGGYVSIEECEVD